MSFHDEIKLMTTNYFLVSSFRIAWNENVSERHEKELLIKSAEFKKPFPPYAFPSISLCDFAKRRHR